MITDTFDSSSPLFTPADFYGPGRHTADIILPVFSRALYEKLLSSAEWEKVGRLSNCNGYDERRILRVFPLGGRRVVFYLSYIGSALAGNGVIECAHITGAKTVISFGSCGSLDAEKTAGKYILPTEAYRDEGFSYHYAPAADYIRMQGAKTVESLFRAWGVPYIAGRVWTTDAFYRETVNNAAKRRSEGCLAVEMEQAGLQALADFEGLRLYSFLETGDTLGKNTYSVGELKTVNDNPNNLALALKLAEAVPLD